MIDKQGMWNYERRQNDDDAQLVLKDHLNQILESTSHGTVARPLEHDGTKTFSLVPSHPRLNLNKISQSYILHYFIFLAKKKSNIFFSFSRGKQVW